MRDIESLVLNPRNNNVHPESQIDRLAKIIKYTGFRSPVVVSTRSGFVVKGHGRIAAARKLGLSQVPVDLQDYDDEAQEWADMIADNKIASYAEFDEALTKEILKDIEASGLDIEQTGFSAEDANAILAAADAIEVGDDHEADDLPERNANAIVKLGDLIELGDHRLICGDATDKATIERLMQGERAKLFATDPPYLVSYEGNEWDEKDTEANKDLYFRFIQTAIDCAIEPNAAFYCWHASARVDILIDAWKRHIVLNHNQIIWVKPAPTLGRSWYLWRHEPCLMGWIKGNKPDRATGEYLNTAWEINRGKDNPDATPVETDPTKS
ncbi:MAG: site-specific DNA-methyltransferase, partial [Opitutales bacterium]|nr:site-specific DNA-methyltransferase [Opitutales bacterium]